MPHQHETGHRLRHSQMSIKKGQIYATHYGKYVEVKGLHAIHSLCPRYDRPALIHTFHKRGLHFRILLLCLDSDLCILGKRDERPSLAHMKAAGQPLMWAPRGERVA